MATRSTTLTSPRVSNILHSTTLSPSLPLKPQTSVKRCFDGGSRSSRVAVRAMMSSSPFSQMPEQSQETAKIDYTSLSEEQWKKRYTKEQFYITRKKGTESAFMGRRRHPSTSQIHSSSAASPATSSLVSNTSNSIRLTYLEINSWLWDVGGVTILVDPILVGNLDFGAPWLFDGAKKVLRNFRLDDLPEIDCLLITQSLDDHCHIRTLTSLSKRMPDLRVVTTPNAEAILKSLFRNVTYLEPGQDTAVEGKNGAKVNIFATAGPILGPPWQRPENGYIIKSGQGRLNLYYEPHCVYNKTFLEKYQADVVITPVVKQLLPSFTLVSGQEDAVHLVKLLKAKYVVPMRNGDLNTNGLLSSILYTEGTTESFKAMLAKELPDTEVLEPKPGIPLEISIMPV